VTGPEHYRAAEQFLEYARNLYGGNQEMGAANVAASIAQAHATLAVTAALAGLDAHEGPGGGSATGRTLAEVNAWDQVLGGES